MKNKVVLITGAASGIGKTTALLFASEGAKVVVSDINEKGGAETVQEIEAAGGTAHFVKANVASYEEVVALVEATVATYGRLDIAVNNAGIGQRKLLKTIEHTLEDWDRVIAVNQSGVFYCMKEELKQMMTQGSGCIVNISSMAGLKGLPNSLSYVASKHAVVGMTKTAALEYARYNIRVNAVCPVFTQTPLFQQMLDYKPEVGERLKRSIPLKRFGKAEEVADAILWLCSERASFVTGHAMPVDGGLSA